MMHFVLPQNGKFTQDKCFDVNGEINCFLSFDFIIIEIPKALFSTIKQSCLLILLPRED